MISLTAQNNFFDALLTIVNTGANNPEIDRFYEYMIAEFETNKTGLNDDEQNKLFANLQMRFIRFSGKRIVRLQLERFKSDELILRTYPDCRTARHIAICIFTEVHNPKKDIQPFCDHDNSLGISFQRGLGNSANAFIQRR